MNRKKNLERDSQLDTQGSGVGGEPLQRQAGLIGSERKADQMALWARSLSAMQEMTHKERSFQACNVCCEKQDQAGNAGRRERAEPSCGGAVLVKALAKRAPLTRALLIGRCRRASERLKKEEIIGDSGSTRCSNSSIYTKTI